MSCQKTWGIKMANPTKKDPHWRVDIEILREITKTAPLYRSTPDEFVEVCLKEQLAIRGKELRVPVRVAHVKKGIYLDIKALGHTLDFDLHGSLKDVFGKAICISSVKTGSTFGKNEEKIYLDSVYFYLLKLKTVDEDLYNDIVSSMDKRGRKWRIFQNYIYIGTQQLLK